MQKFRLHTFGSVFVAEENGEPMGGAAGQRRTLALLTLVATSGDAGLSRDKIVGMLWPDAEPERARHSLTQALYAARRALHCDELFVVGNDVRIDAELLTSDVRELEEAIDAGELERAAELYTGAFLDGFYLTGSPEFEQWVTRQRSRLETRVAGVLEQIAERADEREDHRQAVDARRRLAALRPLDSGGAVRLMTALARAGDRAGALQHARVHEALLKQELDLEPDSAVTALVTRLRAPSDQVEAAPAVAVEQVAAEPEGLRTDSPRAEQPPVSVSVEPIRVWTPEEHHTRRWRSVALTLAAFVIIAIALLISLRRSPPPLEALALRQRLVVAPFRVAGADASLGYLRDGMVELLSTRLADDSAARSVDAGAVLGAWRTAGIAAAMDVSRDSVVKLAARLGAERVVVGSVVGSPSRMIMHATVLAVPSGTVSAEATVTGTSDSLTVLIDRLAARLIASEAGEEDRLATNAPTSLAALRSYLAGQAAYRKGDFSVALQEYGNALRADSTFALAALHAAITAEQLGDDEQVRRGVALAWSSREGLGERDGALLAAIAGPRYGSPSTAAEQNAAWQHVVDLAPASAESWFALGARLYHDGASASVPSARVRATAAFERALSIDPNYLPARGYLALAGVDSASKLAAAESYPRLDAATLRVIALSSLYDGTGMDDGARAVRVLEARGTRGIDRPSMLLAKHAMTLNRGRPHEAASVAAQFNRMRAGSRVMLRLAVLDALYAEGDTADARTAARELLATTGLTAATAPATSTAWLSDVCVLAQWQLQRGDSAWTRKAVAVLRTQPAMRAGSVVSAAPGVCAELLDVSLAVMSRSGDAHARLRQLDSLVLTPQVAGDASAYAHILISRLHERFDDAPGALAAIRRRSYMTIWPRYLASSLREEGRLAQRTGDKEGARDAYTRHLALRHDPEVEMAPEVAAVQKLLSQLK
ncbi:MAG: transcriptional activator protein [Gemmatimonadetes bacterium]|nr:transcriptional activator protein [Gemmatimonadota bacterium]